MNYTAEIIAVGTELLLGNVANTDAQMISEALAGLGINVLYHTAVGDNAARLAEVTEIARKRANLLIFTGGLGPTYDDVTKDIVCRVFGKELVYRADAATTIEHYYDTVFCRLMPEGTLCQAWLPEGCEFFRNDAGTAPGCVFEEGGVTVVLLPGVPSECTHMTHHQLLPWLHRRSGQTIVSRDIRIFGLSEPRVQALLGEVMDNAVNPSLAPYAKTGEVMLRMTAKADSREACLHLMEPMLQQVRAILGDHIYGEDVSSLEEVVITMLRRRGLTLATAESCTGGLIAKRLTDVPGASAAFRGGVVSYTNEVKRDVLGVPQELLDTRGAVSEPVARAMAQGARRITGADLAVSVTGVAGPDRDERGNEVGTVFVGLCTPEGTTVQALDLGRGRERIRTMAAHYTLDMIRRYLAGLQAN